MGVCRYKHLLNLVGRKSIIVGVAPTDMCLQYMIDMHDDIAEVNLRELIWLRCQHPDMEIDYIKAIITYKYLEKILRKQGKLQEANRTLHIIQDYKKGGDISQFLIRLSQFLILL